MALAAAFSVIAAGCTGNYDKAPDKFEKIRWEANDYSFHFTPDNDCKGKIILNDKTYNIKAVVEGSHLRVMDVDNKDAELFVADWMFEDGEKRLFVYNIFYNTEDYKELEGCYTEFFTLKQGKVK